MYELCKKYCGVILTNDVTTYTIISDGEGSYALFKYSDGYKIVRYRGGDMLNDKILKKFNLSVHHTKEKLFRETPKVGDKYSLNGDEYLVTEANSHFRDKWLYRLLNTRTCIFEEGFCELEHLGEYLDSEGYKLIEKGK